MKLFNFEKSEPETKTFKKYLQIRISRAKFLALQLNSPLSIAMLNVL